MPRANRTKRKLHHQTRMSRERNFKEKELQEMKQSTAVTARGSGLVPIGPLLFTGYPPFQLRSPGVCTYINTCMHACIHTLHYTTLKYITLHYILHYITLHYITYEYITHAYIILYIYMHLRMTNI